MISAVLLDFGGTLDGSGLHWLDRFYLIYDALGVPSLTRERIKQAFYQADAALEADASIGRCGLREMMARHVGAQFACLGLADPGLAARISEQFCEPAARALEQSRDVLAAVRQHGCRLAIVSNFYGNVRTLCEEFGLAEHVEFILDSAVEGLRKPDPRFFRAALDRLGARPAQAAFVGDSFERDIRPAHALGMRTFWLAPAGAGCPDAALVDDRIESLEELPARLAESRQPS